MCLPVCYPRIWNQVHVLDKQGREHNTVASVFLDLAISSTSTTPYYPHHDNKQHRQTLSSPHIYSKKKSKNSKNKPKRCPKKEEEKMAARPSTPPDTAADTKARPKPTLLAFHGSGSNATIHSVQLARLVRVIKPYFDIESVEAPFPSPAGPGILPFFEGCGPYKRWLPPTEKISLEAMRAGSSTATMSPEVEAVVGSAVARVRKAGGDVVGLIGFSQGTKVVAGLLRGWEIGRELAVARRGGEQEGEGDEYDQSPLPNPHFGIQICPSYPPPLVPASVLSALDSSTQLSPEQKTALLERKIKIPTFHVIGSNDEWIWAGKSMVGNHFEVGEGMSVAQEWDIGHHYPVAPEDSEKIGEWMREVMRKVEEEGR